jgi:FkbM family methyltransferase
MPYSQNLEEKVILDYFNGYIGSFLSLGENDGITFSNVRALAERGWSGVMVEPSPKAFARLEKNYEGLKGFYLYPFAISGHNGNIILHESGPLVNSNDVALVSTVNAKEMDRFKGATTYEPVTVKCFRWKTFLNRLSIKKFHFISMDIEGEEVNVLPEMDLTDVKCICIEWNGVPELKALYEKYLDGFRLIYTSGENLIYAR